MATSERSTSGPVSLPEVAPPVELGATPLDLAADGERLVVAVRPRAESEPARLLLFTMWERTPRYRSALALDGEDEGTEPSRLVLDGCDGLLVVDVRCAGAFATVRLLTAVSAAWQVESGPAGWPDSIWSDQALYMVVRSRDGGIGLCVAPDPFEAESAVDERAARAAAVLGITQRPRW